MQNQPTGDLPTTMAVSFSVGAQVYALPVRDVVEMVRLPWLLLVGGPRYVCGMLNRAGTYLPVLDAGELLHEPVAYALTSQVLLLRPPSAAGLGRARFGLLVDQVRDVFAFSPAQLTPCDSGTAAPLLCGIVSAGLDSVLLLDAARLEALVPRLGEPGAAEVPPQAAAPALL